MCVCVCVYLACMCVNFCVCMWRKNKLSGLGRFYTVFIKLAIQTGPLLHNFALGRLYTVFIKLAIQTGPLLHNFATITPYYVHVYVLHMMYNVFIIITIQCVCNACVDVIVVNECFIFYLENLVLVYVAQSTPLPRKFLYVCVCACVCACVCVGLEAAVFDMTRACL